MNRLIKHEKNLKDIEACLITEHYIHTKTLPKGQEGRRNRFSWEHEN